MNELYNITMKRNYLLISATVLLSLGLSSFNDTTNVYLLTLTGEYQSVTTNLKESYEPGVVVEFETNVIYDADLDVYLNGQKIVKTYSDQPYWKYEFTMPEQNSVLDFVIVSGDVGF
ncbi:hypothetical protein SDC9_147695 [bioreactor metagenome]|uniref:Uncharacterized protein n=1 Tax=bioreactor metagenome TaxID=1076179 RepID=A0A645EGQ2_9ZZZZ